MKCHACPVAADKPCLGETPRFAHFCAWAAEGGASKFGMIRDRSALPVAPAPEPPDPPQVQPTRFLPTPLEIDRVNLCLYRECRTGCQRSRCFARRAGIQWGDEPATEVTMADCVACMTADTPRAVQ